MGSIEKKIPTIIEWFIIIPVLPTLPLSPLVGSLARIDAWIPCFMSNGGVGVDPHVQKLGGSLLRLRGPMTTCRGMLSDVCVCGA